MYVFSLLRRCGRHKHLIRCAWLVSCASWRLVSSRGSLHRPDMRASMRHHARVLSSPKHLSGRDSILLTAHHQPCQHMRRQVKVISKVCRAYVAKSLQYIHDFRKRLIRAECLEGERSQCPWSLLVERQTGGGTLCHTCTEYSQVSSGNPDQDVIGYAAHLSCPLHLSIKRRLVDIHKLDRTVGHACLVLATRRNEKR